ncbi:class III (anaerobic) ribonucleoside-triphosphate reductase activating protein NrdG [Marinobacterium nitratireducens]|uniref:Class III (Anaerobic) ribonucleoside-triphosphate reductase activating protein NrdG n=1 Tax=Marinobacterium nitratireducens TaxID=518897 RepID=A0A917Z9F7_9GAMM|nr:anaerobic ribonucleoside-triphosphate reductase activating protein [Marinobacterium nitratireducens]GGO76531.1 class III (anaerobic) ribonucleoside-triphosphate reductase activating protein NrdG [Marinobacterium nitratireducens]
MKPAPEINLPVGGITPLTTIDFPDHLACVLYTQGCPLRCGYCQNPHLIPHRAQPDSMSWSAFESWLVERRGFIEAVVFSGGEPTIHADLREAMRRVSTLGYKIGLHSAGVNANRLADLLGLVDWVGLDVKAGPDQYRLITGRPHLEAQNARCVDLLLESGIAFECRTTVNWHLFTPGQVLRLGEALAGRGIPHYAIQLSHGNGCLDPALAEPRRPEPEVLLQLRRDLERLFPRLEWREAV